jgi:hypothetical protein
MAAERWPEGDGMLQRLISGALLVATLTGCGFVRVSQPPSFHMEAALRRCTTPLDSTGPGFSLSGARGTFKEFPAAHSFSDERIEVEWLVANRALHAQVTNKMNATMRVEGVIVDSDDRRRTVAQDSIEPLSALSIPLVSLGEIGSRTDTASDVLRLEIRATVGKEECGYEFRIGAGDV